MVRVQVARNVRSSSDETARYGRHHRSRSDVTKAKLEGAFVDELALLLEVTLRECTARAGLEIPLKTRGTLFVRKLNDDMCPPRAIFCRMRTAAGIVILESRVHLGRQSDIKAPAAFNGFQYVDKAFRFMHARTRSNLAARGL